MKNSNSTRPNLLKIIQDNYYNKQRQMRSGGALASLRSNPYMYNVNPNIDMQDYYNHGGMFLSERAKATQFGQYATGGEPCPEGYIYSEEDDDCIPISALQPNAQTAPQAENKKFNAGFGLTNPKYNFDYNFSINPATKQDISHSASLALPNLFKVGNNQANLNLSGNYSPNKEWRGNISAGIPISHTKGREDKISLTGGMGQNLMSNVPTRNYNAGIEYLGKMFGQKGPTVKINAGYSKFKRGGGYFPEYHSYAPPRMDYGGDPSIPDLNEDFSYMYPNGGGFPRTTAAYVSPSVSAGMRQSSLVPPPVSQYIPKGIMAPAASESTARSFYNPMLGRQTSTATTGVSSSNMASSMTDMNKGKRAAERERMKKINESNQAIAAKDKGAPFTFSNGQTKTWDQMDAREKAYVSGSALKNRFKMFPNEDSPVDRFLNPFNFLVGRVAGNLGTAPYEAKESHSVMPYLTSIGEPLALGYIAHVADPNGTIKSWAKELMNPVPGLFKKHAVNAGEKLGAGMIAAKNLASFARHKGIEEGRTELIEHAREHATEHGEEHKMGGGIYAYADGGSNKRDLSVVNYLASTGRAFDKASRKKLAESMGIKGYSGTANQNIKLLNMIIDRDEANINNQSGVPYDNTPSPRQQPVFNSPTSFAVPQFGRSAAPQQVRTAMTPSVTVVGTDSGFRPYSPENNWQYNIPGVTTSTAPSKQPKTARQAANKKERQANAEAAQQDLRNLESGMITDKGTNMMHVIRNGKVVQSFPVLTGENRNANENPSAMGATKATPTGTYVSQPRSNLYGDRGFHMNPVPAFGQPAPSARGVAQHVTYGANGIDPKEFNRRNALYDQPANKRATTYGCINCQKPNLDYITNAFPQGDTTLVIDSRKAADAQLLKNKFKIKKNGGESDGTYYQGTYFGQGGSFVPEFYSPEYGLPQFMYGVGMEQGGLVKGGEYDMTEEEIQNLIDQGYKIQYI